MFSKYCKRILVFTEFGLPFWQVVDFDGCLEFKVNLVTLLRENGYSIKGIYPYFDVDEYIKESLAAGKSEDEMFDEICMHSGMTLHGENIA